MELETGGERGVEGDAVPQQLSCAHEQHPQAIIGPLLPCGAAPASCPRTISRPNRRLHTAFTLLVSVGRCLSAIYLEGKGIGNLINLKQNTPIIVDAELRAAKAA